jgi:hypothetical protein
MLASGGVATLLVAVFRQPRHSYSLAHELAVIAVAVTCCTWPLLASHRRHPVLLLTRTPSLAAAGVSLGLATWYALESHGALLGLAERCAVAVPTLWLLAVAITTSLTFTPPAPSHEPSTRDDARRSFRKSAASSEWESAASSE